MSDDELFKQLTILAAQEESGDIDAEDAHIKADRLLLEYIGNENITAAFDSIHKWYS